MTAALAEIIRQIALTGCRRSEIIELMWKDADTDSSCLRLVDSKEGSSIHPIGLPVVEYLGGRKRDHSSSYVFPGSRMEDGALVAWQTTGNKYSKGLRWQM